MPNVSPDYSFEHEGITLRAWLIRLVSSDRKERDAAGAALQALQMGPFLHTDMTDLVESSLTTHQERFHQAIRDVVNTDGIDKAEFITKLYDMIISCSDNWSRLYSESIAKKEPGNRQWDRIAEKLTSKINNAIDEGIRVEATKRLHQALRAITARECEIDEELYADPEIMSNARIMAQVVIRALGHELLSAPAALQVVLEHRQLSYVAVDALKRIGPPAIAFYPQLLDRLVTSDVAGGIHCDHNAAEALASIGKGNEVIVRELCHRLNHEHEQVREAAACALAVMGTDVADREPEIVRVLSGLCAGDVTYSVVQALASVGRHDPEARRRILDIARPRPPIWETAPAYPDHKYDRVMYDRGYAIDAIACLTDYPQECVPVLVDAIDSFVEFNVDLEYSGPAARVAHALERFGPKAAAAALPLAKKLGECDEDTPRAIFAALTAMGPSASAALGELERYRKRFALDDPLPDLTTKAPDCVEDPVGFVMHAIRGQNRQ